MNQLLVALDAVDTHLSQVCDLMMSKVSKKRSVIVREFQNAETVVESQIEVLKKVPQKPRNVKRNLIGLRNLCQAVHQGVEDQELTPSEVRTMIRENIKPIQKQLLASAESVRAKHDQEQRVEKAVGEKVDTDWQEAISQANEQADGKDVLAAARRVLRDGETERVRMEDEIAREKKANDRCRKKLLSYRKFEKRLATANSAQHTKLKQGQFIPVECPIFVSFSSLHLQELDTLDAIGFQTTSVSSLESGTPDVALILENQILLQFSKNSAREQLLDNYQQQRKQITSSDQSKLLRRKNRELKKAQEALENLQKTIDTTKSAAIKKLSERKLPEQERTVASLEGEIEHIKAVLKRDRHAITVSQRETITKSKIKDANGRSRVILKSKALEFHVNKMLDIFHEHGKHYSLLSKEFIPHPELPDVLVAWLVPTEQAQFCRKIYTDQNLVASWGFPWKVHV